MNPARELFNALFSDMPEESRVLIWSLPSKASYWYEDVETASDGALALGTDADVYFGVGISPEGFGKRRRCPADKVAAISCLWADLDIAESGIHKKKRLPPSQSEAVKIIENFPKASYIIHSGHGLQCFWVFKEPWVFEDKSDRKKAAALCQTWSTTLRESARHLGYEIDSVGDLSRVLRVPGTVNNKGTPVPVEIIVSSDLRYNPDDFDLYLVEETAGGKTILPETVRGVTLTLSPGAEPPFDKFQALIDNIPKAAQTWERKRRDMKDSSASGYDMALASFAGRAGWTDQEIADLMIANRRKHEDDLKLREDYYRRTIDRVRRTIKVDNSDDVLDEIEDINDPQEKRQAKLDFLTEAFGIKVRRIVRYMHELQPLFQMETEDYGVIHLGEVRNLTEQTNFRRKLQEMVLKNPPMLKGKKWQRIVTEMLSITKTIEGPEESKLSGRATIWVDSYLQNGGVATGDEVADAIEERKPFEEEGHVYVFGDEFRKHVNIRFNERVTDRMMGVYLRSCGCAIEKINIEQDGKATSRTVWKVKRRS